jgi:hypothetical protein
MDGAVLPHDRGHISGWICSTSLQHALYRSLLAVSHYVHVIRLIITETCHGLTHFYCKCKNVVFECVGDRIFCGSLSIHGRLIASHCTVC